MEENQEVLVDTLTTVVAAQAVAEVDTMEEDLVPVAMWVEEEVIFIN